MKIFFILFFSLIFSANTKAACTNVREIHYRSIKLEESFSDLIHSIKINFPRRYNFYEFAVRAESDVRFMTFSTQSGAMPCEVTVNSFTQLGFSFNVLKNFVARFQSRRPKLYRLYKSEWSSTTKNFQLLKELIREN